jgi:uncharacterized membrane protein YebE (DUF533 family)
MPSLLRRRRTPDDISDQTLEAIAPGTAADAPPAAAQARRSAVEVVLAAKVLQGHLDERRAALRARPSNLRDVPAETVSLLVRAMGAAGHADGRLDEREARRIDRALRTVTTLDEAAKAALREEIETPPCLESLARQVTDEDTATRFYAVSVVTAEKGKASNRSYLTYVAQRLSVPRDVVVRLNRRFDIPV